MRILTPGNLSLASWEGRIECSTCGLVAIITYTDIEFKDKVFCVTCPTDGCGLRIHVRENGLPRVVRTAVKRNAKNVN